MKTKRRVERALHDVVHQRRRWSDEQKRELVERWCESGASRAEFCRREGLCYSRFLVWVAEVSGAETGPQFLEVTGREVGMSKEVKEGGERLEVVAPNGWRVWVGERFDSGAAERLLGIVSRC